MDDEKDQLRAALQEIERLIGEAARSGVPVERWVEQFAEELRAAFPEEGANGGADLAHRILSDPDRSIVAQARIDGANLRTLKDLIVALSR